MLSITFQNNESKFRLSIITFFMKSYIYIYRYFLLKFKVKEIFCDTHK